MSFAPGTRLDLRRIVAGRGGLLERVTQLERSPAGGEELAWGEYLYNVSSYSGSGNLLIPVTLALTSDATIFSTVGGWAHMTPGLYQFMAFVDFGAGATFTTTATGSPTYGQVAIGLNRDNVTDFDFHVHAFIDTQPLHLGTLRIVGYLQSTAAFDMRPFIRGTNISAPAAKSFEGELWIARLGDA